MKRIDGSEVVRLSSQGMTFVEIARLFRTDVEMIEYIYDREYLRWASRYGYDN